MNLFLFPPELNINPETEIEESPIKEDFQIDYHFPSTSLLVGIAFNRMRERRETKIESEVKKTI